ncbi:MAG: endo alpha-1,4 polygalactosaminidase [Candidatus Aegiribacteria sp.]|nr:endo alpha-1,4 polygalactosaminidase [Candidatus Aegiribacteria sp.]
MRISRFGYIVTSVVMLSAGCVTDSGPDESASINYRNEMRDLVENISSWSKSISPSFIIVPQNGHELITENGEPEGSVDISYIGAVDGFGREDLFFGYNSDDTATPSDETSLMMSFLDLGLGSGKTILVTDYCQTHWKIDSSYAWCQDAGYTSFAADQRALDNIPNYPVEPWNINQNDVTELVDAQNFLYLINPGQYSSSEDFINSLAETDYDLLIVDLFWDDQQLTPSDINQLQSKQGGGSRIVLAYMSIGEAEDYRYYWQSDWNSNPPGWLKDENPEWEGNYLIEYWDIQWQEIIFGSSDSYLGRILNCGFDGVYLDKIDAFDTWEEM